MLQFDVKEFQKPFQINTLKGFITQACAPSNQFLKMTAPKGLGTQACVISKTRRLHRLTSRLHLLKSQLHSFVGRIDAMALG